MSMAHGLVKELESTQKFFNKTISIFEPGDARYAPMPELYTVAGAIAHTADSIDWFIEGAFGKGWDMEFEALIAKAKAVTSLEEATDWIERAFANAADVGFRRKPRRPYCGYTHHARRAAVGCGIGHHRPHCAPSRSAVSLRAVAGESPANAIRVRSSSFFGIMWPHDWL